MNLLPSFRPSKLAIAIALPAMAVAVSFLYTGCAGYQLGPVKPASAVGVDRIFVPPFKNHTLEPRLSSLVTNAVIREIQADGTYQIGTRANADAILVGNIRTIRKKQLRSARGNTLQSEELTLNLDVDYSLQELDGTPLGVRDEDKDISKDEPIVGRDINTALSGKVSGEAIQNLSDNNFQNNFQVGERNAFAVAAQDLARILVSRISNGW